MLVKRRLASLGVKTSQQSSAPRPWGNQALALYSLWTFRASQEIVNTSRSSMFKTKLMFYLVGLRGKNNYAS